MGAEATFLENRISSPVILCFRSGQFLNFCFLFLQTTDGGIESIEDAPMIFKSKEQRIEGVLLCVVPGTS